MTPGAQAESHITSFLTSLSRHLPLPLPHDQLGYIHHCPLWSSSSCSCAPFRLWASFSESRPTNPGQTRPDQAIPPFQILISHTSFLTPSIPLQLPSKPTPPPNPRPHSDQHPRHSRQPDRHPTQYSRRLLLSQIIKQRRRDQGEHAAQDIPAKTLRRQRRARIPVVRIGQVVKDG